MRRAFRAVVYLMLIGLVSGMGWASAYADPVKPAGTIEQRQQGAAMSAPVRPHVTWLTAHRWMKGRHSSWLWAHRWTKAQHLSWLKAHKWTKAQRLSWLKAHRAEAPGPK
jgi:hypothetical protein